MNVPTCLRAVCPAGTRGRHGASRWILAALNSALGAQHRVVDAFLAAAREGDFDGLLEVLDPDVVLRRDVAPLGGSGEVRGARAVAGQALAYSRYGALMRPALVNGAVGAVAVLDCEPFAVGAFTVRGGRIVEIDILADPERLSKLDLTILDNDSNLRS